MTQIVLLSAFLGNAAIAQQIPGQVKDESSGAEDKPLSIFFAPSRISDELEKVRISSLNQSPEAAKKTLSEIARLLKVLNGTGKFQRVINGQIVDSGKSIRDGLREVTFSELSISENKVSVREDAYSIRTEYENLDGVRGEVKLLNRVVNRATLIEFSTNSAGDTEYKTFRINDQANLPTSTGFALVQNDSILIAAQSKVSDYPTGETTTVKAFSQSYKQILPIEGKLITSAVTLKLPDEPGGAFTEFGEWDQVTSEFIKNEDL